MKRTAAILALASILPLFLLSGTAQIVVVFLQGTVAGANTGDANCIVLPTPPDKTVTESTTGDTTVDTTIAEEPAPEGTGAVTIELVLATIRRHESTNNYTARAPKGSASGAYQFVDGTWNNYGGYPSAWMAPPTIQDERARILAEPILRRWGLSGVPIGWYYPAALGNPSWLDRVPHPEYGNRLTVREYQTRWLDFYRQVSGGALPIDGCNLPEAAESSASAAKSQPTSHPLSLTPTPSSTNPTYGAEPDPTSSTAQDSPCAHTKPSASTSPTPPPPKPNTDDQFNGALSPSNQATSSSTAAPSPSTTTAT
jgi:Transglycosylase-like domain